MPKQRDRSPRAVAEPVRAAGSVTGAVSGAHAGD